MVNDDVIENGFVVQETRRLPANDANFYLV